MKKILLIEDNIDFAKFLKNTLEDQKYDVDATDDFADAISMVASKTYDLIISDLHLPEILGTQLIKTLRTLSPDTKTMILTAEPTESSELDSITYHVDMYVDKAKGIRIILKYIEKLLEQQTTKTDPDFLYSKSENIIVDVRAHRVTKDDIEHKLTATEFSLLLYLLSNVNNVLTREDISQHLWNIPYDGSRKIDLHIRNLRVKLGLTSIHTLYGEGFRWYEE